MVVRELLSGDHSRTDGQSTCKTSRDSRIDTAAHAWGTVSWHHSGASRHRRYAIRQRADLG
jgi:hypothetical protein